MWAVFRARRSLLAPGRGRCRRLRSRRPFLGDQLVGCHFGGMSGCMVVTGVLGMVVTGAWREGQFSVTPQSRERLTSARPDTCRNSRALVLRRLVDLLDGWTARAYLCMCAIHAPGSAHGHSGWQATVATGGRSDVIRSSFWPSAGQDEESEV